MIYDEMQIMHGKGPIVSVGEDFPLDGPTGTVLPGGTKVMAFGPIWMTRDYRSSQ